MSEITDVNVTTAAPSVNTSYGTARPGFAMNIPDIDWKVVRSTKVLYTGGTFDLFHSGHVNFLKACKNIVGDEGEVVVALNTDEMIKDSKKVEPLPYKEREAVLLSCRYVDRVVENVGGMDSKPAILGVNPDIIAIGTDWSPGYKDYYKQMNFTQEWLDEHQITLVYVPYTQEISSTKIRERLRNG
ncbi:MAG: adenylyltransferase/cytidyltransferase family protein [Betaproteobacteria bacterium]|jgi:glycerol-3-phosphate cytidylyltransferase